jgi:peptidoglycan L-alanyl-D-glutamate endopeptidase CwlK
MGVVLTERDMTRLNNVHPDLKKVVLRAAEITPVAFMVLEGVRTRQQCMVNYGKGRNAAQLAVKGIPASFAQPTAAKVTWLNNPFNSKHCVQDDGYGHAVDLCPLPVDWNNLLAFDKVASAMEVASDELGIDIRWGADWDEDGRPRERGETDSPHFELG